MNKPEIICHILQSIDGNIDGAFFGQPEASPAFTAFARIRNEYNCDAVISGATTAAEIYTDGYVKDLPEAKEKVPRTDWQAAKADHYAVVIDGQGTLHWRSGTVDRRGTKMHVIAVLQDDVSDAYLCHLREAQVSYIFAGKSKLDLRFAVQKLYGIFGIRRMLLSGGGVVDWSFLQAGLVDEISLVIPPVIDGATNVATAFDDSGFTSGHDPVAMKLKDVQKLEGDAVWLRYTKKEKGS